jgi:endonuclease/exonuclease/phosphatase family metal-dependent hydrolase
VRYILLITFFFNLYAADSNLVSCFEVFNYQSISNNSSKAILKKFPYSFSNTLKFNPNKASIRNIHNIEDMRLGTYNLENFAKTSKYLNSEQVASKTKKIMDSITESKLDIVVLQEILDPDYLSASVREHLNDTYKVMMIDVSGVSDKIAFLVKKDLPLKFKLHSMGDYKVGGRRAFNKDFPILEIIDEDRPLMFFGGLHLKSMFGGKTSNNFFSKVRESQLKSILQIQNKIAKNYSEAPFIIAGDFNNNLAESVKEFDLLKQYMTDTFDLSLKTPNSRLTNITNYKGNRITSQLDGFFVNNNRLEKVSVKSTIVYQSSNSSGFKVSLEDPRATRDQFVSDHSLVVTTLDFQKLLNR